MRYIITKPNIDTSIGLSLGNLSPRPETIEDRALVIIPGVHGEEFNHTLGHLVFRAKSSV